MKSALTIIITLSFILLLTGTAHAQTPQQPPFLITATSGGTTTYLEPNVSGQYTYPDLNIQMYTGTWSISINNHTMETGSGPYDYKSNLSIFTTVNIQITDNGITYNMINVHIINTVNDVPVISSYIITTLTGQADLDANPDQTQLLLHQNATIYIESSFNTTYKIYVQDNEIATGTVNGITSVNTTLPEGTTTIIVTTPQATFSYKNEIVTALPQYKYYGPKPPSLIATLIEEILSQLKGVIATTISIIFIYLALKGPIQERKDNEPRVW